MADRTDDDYDKLEHRAAELLVSLRGLLAWAERMEVETDQGACRTLKDLEKAGLLDEEIYRARAAVAQPIIDRLERENAKLWKACSILAHWVHTERVASAVGDDREFWKPVYEATDEMRRAHEMLK